MAATTGKDVEGKSAAGLFVKFTFVFLFFQNTLIILVGFVAILIHSLGRVIVLVVFGNNVEAHGMNLHDLKFRVALKAGEDFSFFDLVFVQVNFRVAFRASHHGEFSLAAKSTTCERII
jgi:hypothetical protein